MTKLNLSGETVSINGSPVRKIYGGFGDGQPCILAKQVAELHGQELKEINRIVNNNRDWFEEGVDIIDLKKEIISDGSSGVISNHLSDFLIESGFYANTQAIGGAKHIYLFSQQGYALLCKLLKSDLAKLIYKQMVRDYFRMRGWIEGREDVLDRLEMTARRFDRMMDRLELFVERVLSLTGTEVGEEGGGDAGIAGGMSGWELDVASGRFMKIAGVSEFLGMEKTLAADVANNVTKHTSGTDMMDFLYPFCFSASGHAEAFASLSEYGGEREILTVFLSEWVTNFGERAVSSRELYEMVARVGVPLDLGAGSEHSRKVRLGKMLAKLAGQEIGDCRIVDAGKRKGLRVWRLEEC